MLKQDIDHQKTTVKSEGSVCCAEVGSFCAEYPTKAREWNYSIVNDPMYTKKTNLVAGQNSHKTDFKGKYGDGSIEAGTTGVTAGVGYQRLEVGNKGTWDDGNTLINYPKNLSLVPTDMASLTTAVGNSIKAEVSCHLGVGTMTINNLRGFSVTNHLNNTEFNLGASAGGYAVLGIEGGGGFGKMSTGEKTYSYWYIAPGLGMGGGVSFDMPDSGGNWIPMYPIDSLKLAALNMLEEIPGTDSHTYWQNEFQKRDK